MTWEKGGAVLLGVVLTLLVTLLKEAVSALYKRRAERTHVSVQLVLMLDEYASQCAAVAGDDGTWRGQTDKEGNLTIQTNAPDLDYSIIKGEWKYLWPDFIYQVHDLVLLQKFSEKRIDFDFEYCDPPDRDEAFTTRQYEYSRLGLMAYSLANAIRQRARLPERIWNQGNPIDYLKSTIERIDEEREAKSKCRGNRPTVIGDLKGEK